MKNIKFAIIFLTAILSFASCNKNRGSNNPDTSTGSIIGTWEMTQWSNTQNAVLYVEFSADGKFNLYQRIYSPYFENLKGTWEQNGNTISGKYDDGEPWTSQYNVAFSENGTKLSLTKVDNPEDKSNFVKSEIPEDVKSGILGTRSTLNTGYRFL